MLDSPLLQETRQFSRLLVDTLIKDQHQATGGSKLRTESGLRGSGWEGKKQHRENKDSWGKKVPVGPSLQAQHGGIPDVLLSFGRRERFSQEDKGQDTSANNYAETSHI